MFRRCKLMLKNHRSKTAMEKMPVSDWHREVSVGSQGNRELKRCQESDSPSAAWSLCSKPLTALGPGHASREGTSHQPPVPMPRPQCLAAPPSHRVVSAFGAVSTHKFMDQLSLLIWLQDETINRCQTHWQ